MKKCKECGNEFDSATIDGILLCSRCDLGFDKINPSHYKQGNIEVADFILDQKMNYLEGNIIKYVSRYKNKNGVEDLKKAQWYINKLIETLGTKI